MLLFFHLGDVCVVRAECCEHQWWDRASHSTGTWLWRIPVLLFEGWSTLPCIPALPHPNFLPWYWREWVGGFWIWKEKLELLLQWIQTGLSSVFEVAMRAVSCTRWPKLLPGHTAQSKEVMELRICFCELWIQHQQLIGRTPTADWQNHF